MKKSSAKWQPDDAALTNAQLVLPQLVHEYFTSGRKLDSKSSAKEVHGFRLKTKRLRYTLDAFLALYGPGLQAKAEGLRPIQNALGDANDCEVLLEERGEQLPHGIRSYLVKRAKKLRKEFLAYWKKEFDADGEQEKWENYLRRTKRSRPAK